MDSDQQRPSSRFRIRRPTWRGWFSIAILAFLSMVLGAWAIDYGTLGDRIARHVTVERVDIGRKSETSLHKALARANTEYGSGTVIFMIKGKKFPMPAGEIGLTLDEDATVAAAHRIGRDDPPLLRPLSWAISWIRPRPAPVRVMLDRAKLTKALAGLPGQVPVVEPAVTGSVDTIGVTEGRGGIEFNPASVAARIESVARNGRLPLRVSLVAEPVEPRITSEQVNALAAQAQALTNRSITVLAPGVAETIGPAQLRSWITSRLSPGSRRPELAFKSDLVVKSLRAQIGDVVVPPQDATFTVTGDQVLLVPQVNGERCCSITSAAVILRALEAAQPTATLPLDPEPPTFTTEDASKLGITTLLGAGLTAGPQQIWVPDSTPDVSTPSPTASPSDSDTTVTSTTLPAAGGAGQFIVPIPALPGELENIENAIPLLRGRIIGPGKDLSLNDVFGAPSPANGFGPADVLTADGPTWVSGGGTDLIAAGLFQAAFASGLDITASGSPTVLRPGIPPGIDATLGWPAPDLRIANPSTSSILVWVDLVRGGLRVQLFGTPFTSNVATATRQTPYGPDNACLDVAVTRTRTFLDGRQVTDRFDARYTPPPAARDDPDRVVCPS